MIERNNPQIDVDELMLRIQREVARRRLGPEFDTRHTIAQRTALDTTAIESLLGAAQQRAEARAQWSQRLNVFPLNRMPWLQRFSLRIFNFIFRDQRQVNFTLIQALREMLQINSELDQRVSALEARLNDRQPRRFDG